MSIVLNFDLHDRQDLSDLPSSCPTIILDDGDATPRVGEAVIFDNGDVCRVKDVLHAYEDGASSWILIKAYKERYAD